MITFTDEQGLLGTIELSSGGLAASTRALQRIADQALVREHGNAAAAYARLLRSGNAYVQVAEAGSVGAQLAVELATGTAWLHELRDEHGEWVHSPADKPGTGLDRYKVPPHERLINPRADHPDPASYPFFVKHPVSADNIIAAYDAVPKEMREAGMHWYSDAHLLARALAHGNAEKGAILLANYSPQANWPINMFRAARVADEGKPIPAGEGYISGDQVKKAQRALNGEHIDQVLVSPKTRSFAHLLANGGDSPDDPYGHVVIDAHALNVAAGGTVRGATYASDQKRKTIPPEDLPPIGSDVRAHEYVGDMYRQAASYISHRDGQLIKPHQLQAVTWVAQVLANQAEDRAMMATEGTAKGRLSARARDWTRWLAYARGHHLQLIPGVSALAAQVLEADLEQSGEDSLFAQLIDLAAWEHELRDARGRWVKSGIAGAAKVIEERAAPATAGDLRMALIKSQVYSTQQFDHMQDEINHLQAELDKEGKDEAKAVLTTHLAWIGAGIAVALVLSGVGLPPAVALLAATLPSIGSEFSELAVVLGKGREHLAHPAAKFKALLARHRPQFAMAADPLRDQAAAVVAAWLAQTGYTGPGAAELAHALVDAWAEDNADRLAAARGQQDMAGSVGSQLGVIELFNPGQPRDPKGRWAREPGIGEQIGRVHREITAAEARGNSRPVSRGQFQHLAAIGAGQLDMRKRAASPVTGLDRHWDAIKRDSYAAVQQPWGGKTIDAHTGTPLRSDADLYALSVKPPRLATVSVPEHASEAEFGAAMDQARQQFRSVLQRRDYHLGVFHDDDHHRIDIDPVLVVGTPAEVETIGAYAHSIGGAYHFRTGDGYWPPHVAAGADMAADQQVRWAGPGQWHSYADAVQDGEPADDGSQDN